MDDGVLILNILYTYHISFTPIGVNIRMKKKKLLCHNRTVAVLK